MRKTRILIVEDDPIIAEDIKYTLEAQDMDVCGVLQMGEDVYNYASRTKPDLVLMDIHLAGKVNGIEAAKKVWNMLNLPSIYLTAYSDHKTVQDAKQSYPFGFLIKPFKERELVIAIEIAMNQRQFSPLMEVSDNATYCALRKNVTGSKTLPNSKLQKTGVPYFFKTTDAQASSFNKALGDLTADVLDILCYRWLQLEDTTSSIVISADDILYLRGLQQQKSGTGRRGGYEVKWRKQVALQMEVLAHLWLVSNDMSSPVLDYQQGDSEFSWLVKPGEILQQEIFTNSPETALLSQCTLQYNPHKQSWEKRLARYLSHKWRVHLKQPKQPILVQQLLDEVEAKIDKIHPQRTKNRLEKALNQLMHDRVVEKWSYISDDINTRKKHWLTSWKNEELQIVEPLNILEHYSDMTPGTDLNKSGSLTFIKYFRQERKLSLMEAASEIGITHARLSQIERGDRPGPKTLKKIKTWLLRQIK